MSDFVWQTANLAGFISGCYTNDLDMIRAVVRGRGHRAAACRRSFRASARAQVAAMAAGALGCSISGAGPAVFAWCEEPRAENVRRAMVAAFDARNLASDHWITSIEPRGARLIDR